MDDSVNRDENGKFKPGNPGGGRTKMDPEVREILRAATPMAAERLVEALSATDKDGAADHELRMKAAERIMDRIWGRPVQAVSGEDGGPVPLDVGIVSILKKLAGE